MVAGYRLPTRATAAVKTDRLWIPVTSWLVVFFYRASADVFLSIGCDDRDRVGVIDVAMSLADMDRLQPCDVVDDPCSHACHLNKQSHRKK